jgi:hypothetical protein
MKHVLSQLVCRFLDIIIIYIQGYKLGFISMYPQVKRTPGISIVPRDRHPVYVQKCIGYKLHADLIMIRAAAQDRNYAHGTALSFQIRP